MSVYKRHLAFSEASERRNHSEVLYLNLFKKTTTCVVAKPLVYIMPSIQKLYISDKEKLVSRLISIHGATLQSQSRDVHLWSLKPKSLKNVLFWINGDFLILVKNLYDICVLSLQNSCNLHLITDNIVERGG